MRNATAYYVAVERASEQTHERSGTAGAPLSSDLTGRASATRALAVVTSHPPATADEAEALLNIVIEITSIYPVGRMT